MCTTSKEEMGAGSILPHPAANHRPTFPPSVHFLPYIGPRFNHDSSLQMRVLIVDEAHHAEEGDPADRYLTRRMLGEIAAGKWTAHRFTSIQRTFALAMGREFSTRDFWESVAYYVFVQESLLPSPTIRPTEEMVARSRKPFVDVLDILDPDAVLVLGEGNWQNLPDEGYGRDGPELDAEVPEGASCYTWRYELPGKRPLLAWRVRHPLRGYSPDAWHHGVRRFLSVALHHRK